MRNNLRTLYKKQTEIQDLRKRLNELESEFKELCEYCVEKGQVEEGPYQLVVKERKVRKVTDPRAFIQVAGDIGWACVSVSVQKSDALNIAIPKELLEIHKTNTYQVLRTK